MRKFLFFSCLFALLSLASLCQADDNHHPLSNKKEKWGLGIGAGGYWGTSEYKGITGGIKPMPAFNYDSQYAYIRGMNAGVHLIHNKRHEFNIQLTYLSQGYSADSSNDDKMKLLDDRFSSLGGGVNYVVKTKYGVVQSTLTTDLLGVSNGVTAIVAYVVPWHDGAWDIIPSIGLHWTDANYNRYYYGVSKHESKKSGLRSYEPGSAISPGAQLTMKYNFIGNWNVFAHAGLTVLGGAIRYSPMVDSDIKASGSIGIMYEF